MTEKERWVLAIFGHAKPVPFSEFITLNLFSRYRMKLDESKKYLRELLDNGWIKRTYKDSSPEGDTYILDRKGDEAFRMEQIRRGGEYRWFKYFQRDLQSARRYSDGSSIHEFDAVKDKLNLENKSHRQVFDMLKRQKDRLNRMEEARLKRQ